MLAALSGFDGVARSIVAALKKAANSAG